MVENILSKSDADNIWKNKEFLAKGKRGFVYLTNFNGKKYLIKTTNSSSDALGTILKESINNQTLNKIGVGPNFLYYDEDKDFMIREFVDGERIFDWIDQNREDVSFKKKLLFVVEGVLDQCRKMDVLGFNKYEMTNPYKDLLINKNLDVSIIDFERCRFTNRPKNVTQFCQFLVKGKMHLLLSDLGVFLTRERMSNLAESYKSGLKESEFNKIKEEIRKAFGLNS